MTHTATTEAAKAESKAATVPGAAPVLGVTPTTGLFASLGFQSSAKKSGQRSVSVKAVGTDADFRSIATERHRANLALIADDPACEGMDSAKANHTAVAAFMADVEDSDADSPFLQAAHKAVKANGGFNDNTSYGFSIAIVNRLKPFWPSATVHDENGKGTPVHFMPSDFAYGEKGTYAEALRDTILAHGGEFGKSFSAVHLYAKRPTAFTEAWGSQANLAAVLDELCNALDSLAEQFKATNTREVILAKARKRLDSAA